MPKEGAPEVTFRYVDRRLTSALRSLLALASAALTLALALLLRSRRKGVDVSARLRTLVPATLAVLGAIALDGWLFGPFVPSLVAGLLSAVVLTDLLLPEKSAPVAEPGGTTEIC
jgi:CHASE2 domain-containing sensor protein